MANTSKWFCQNCRKEVTKDNRYVIKLQDPNKDTLIRKVQVCRKCVKKINDYMIKIEGRTSWTNRKYALVTHEKQD